MRWKRPVNGYVFVVVFSLLVTFYAQFYFLTHRYSAPEDVREGMIWMAHQKDPALFKDDLLLEYENWKTPAGMKALYYITGRFFDPLTVVKLLPFFLCAAAAVYSYRLGTLLKNRNVGVLLSVLVVLNAWCRELSFNYCAVWFGDANAGAFDPLLWIMFFFYFLKKDFFKTALVMAAQSLIYPPSLLVATAAYGIGAVTGFAGKPVGAVAGKRLLYLAVVIAIAFSTVFFKYGNPSPRLGRGFTLNEMKQMPEFFPGGRTPLFYPDFYQRIANSRSGLGLGGFKIGLLFAALLLAIPLGRKAWELPPALWIILFSSLALFFLAQVLLLKLYDPERYVRYPGVIMLLIFICLNIDRIITGFVHKSRDRTALYALCCAMSFLIYLPGLQNVYSCGNDDKNDVRLYDFLSQSSRDAVFAAHPAVMDDVIVFCRRKGLVSGETSVPYLKNYYAQISMRTGDFFSAYYSDSAAAVYRLCKKYKIDYLILYHRDFSRDYLNAGRYYYAPFNEHIKKILAENPGRRFGVFALPEESIVFKDRKYTVFDCRGFNREEAGGNRAEMFTTEEPLPTL